MSLYQSQSQSLSCFLRYPILPYYILYIIYNLLYNNKLQEEREGFFDVIFWTVTVTVTLHTIFLLGLWAHCAVQDTHRRLQPRNPILEATNNQLSKTFDFFSLHLSLFLNSQLSIINYLLPLSSKSTINENRWNEYLLLASFVLRLWHWRLKSLQTTGRIPLFWE